MDMTKMTAMIVVLAGLGSGAVAEAACQYPAEIQIPEGASATKEQMVAANGAVKEYMGKVEDYLGCLDREEAELGDKVTDEQKQIHTARHNAAVDALNAVAARYNEQVQAYKKAGGK
jgi:hypothetical protein